MRAWEAAKLGPIGLHEARHTFASYLIAAGLDLKAISTYMGHASVSFTIDRYGHLLPDTHAEQAARLDESDGFAWPQRDGLKWPHLALVGVVVHLA